MNRYQLTEYIGQPERMNEQSLAELKDVIDEYPFFQAARMLLVKNLHSLDHIRYNNELKLAAAHISDREKMFFLLNDYQKLDVAAKSDISVVDNYVDDTIQKQDDKKPDNEHIVLPVADLLDYERENNAYFDLSDLSNDNLDEFRSFSSWLKQLRDNKTQPEEQQNEKTQSDKNEKMALIDNFLQKGASQRMKIDKSDSDDNEDFSIKSLQENDDLMTETLANIHIKQKHFSKAINIFEQLRLKYPEKNIYFALRIKELKERINNL